MGKALRVLVCVLGSLLVGVASSGAEDMRPYVRMSGVYVLSAGSSVEDNTGPRVSGTLDLDSTIGVVGAFGMEWDSRVQTELEIGYRSMGFGRLEGTIEGITSGETEAEGDISTLMVMVNGRYVFKPTVLGGIHPYLGGGLGVAFHTVELGVPALSFESESDAAVLAYQVMVGAEYDLTDSVGTHAGYRFVGTGDYKDRGTTASYTTHGFEFGLSYRF